MKVDHAWCRAAHQALDAENGHRWLPFRTWETTRRAYMANLASVDVVGGGRLRCNSGARMGVQGRFVDASGSTRQPNYNPSGVLRRLAAPPNDFGIRTPHFAS